MLNKPVYFVSDNHFKYDVDSDEKDRRKKLYHVFNKIKKTKGTLIIGGDFFDFWFYYPHMIPVGYHDLMEKLSSLNESGIAINFVLGNHDYWDFGYFKKKFNGTVYSGNLNFTHNDSKIQVCHGDGLLKNDVGYRIMKKIIRNKLFIFLFKNIPPNWGYSIAKKISKTSEHYHHHDKKSQQIKNEMLDYAKSQWLMGYTTVLIGHYHQTGIMEENGKYLIFMGDWLRHFTVTRLDENGWWQGKWDEL